MSFPQFPLVDLVADRQISYGVVQPGSDSASGVPIVRVKDVRNRIIDTSSPMRVDAAIESKHIRTRLTGGELLLSIVGTVGESAVVPDTLSGWNVARAIAVIRPTEVSSRWLQLCFDSPVVRSHLDSVLNTTVQATLNLSDLKEIPIPVPSLETRRAIAEVLGALDDKIATNTKLAATVEALGTAKLQALGINDEPDNGAVTLDTLFDFNPRRTPASDTVTLIDMQALPTSEPLIETWSEGPKKGGTRFMNGDTLLARITPCLENRKTGFVDFLNDGQVGIGSTEFIVMRSHKGLPLGLSYFVATSSRFRDFAIQNMVGTSGRQRVAASDVARFEFNPIEHSDLVQLGTWADTNLRLLGSLRTENKVLAATRDALLPQLMSGKLRVRDAEALVSAAV